MMLSGRLTTPHPTLVFIWRTRMGTKDGYRQLKFNVPLRA